MDLVNMPNWLALSFRLEDEDWFDPLKVEILNFRLELDLKRGILTRFIKFADEKGRRTMLKNDRFVHMRDQHKAALQATITPENWIGRMELRKLGYSFEHETIPRNVEYYLKRTSHGSTLSRVVHSF